MSHQDYLLLYAKIGFWCSFIGTAARLVCLAWHDYPRVLKWSRGEDALIVFLNCIVLPLLWWVAWGYS